MSFSSYVVASRAPMLARLLLILDLLLAAALYVSDAPATYLIAPAAAAILLAPYLRYVARSPVALTIGMLGLTALMLGWAGLALNGGVVLWVLLPLLPAGAGFTLGRRRSVWHVAIVCLAAMAIAVLLLIRGQAGNTIDLRSLGTFLAALTACILLASWFAARAVRPDPTAADVLAAPLQVAKGILIVPLNWASRGIQAEVMRLELNNVRRTLAPRWIVLDLGTAGELSPRDLNAIERAAGDVTSSHCTVVLARPPVDALGHLDMAQPAINRIERFATVPQAVEAGLRRLGWTQEAEQGQRIVTRV
jgi:hypothetical protein